jgi:hypothetical protein
MKKPIVYDTPFKPEYKGIVDGYHQILMGRTTYCVKDNVISIVDRATGELKELVEADLPKSKRWIRRNIDEVLASNLPKMEKLVTSLVSKSRNSYVVAVNGTEYVISISSDFTRNFDEYVYESNAPSFSWLSVQIIKNGMKQSAPADVVNDPKFQMAVKAVVNPQRKLARVTQHHSFDQWRSKRECRDYRNKQHNTDAFGTTFK